MTGQVILLALAVLLAVIVVGLVLGRVMFALRTGAGGVAAPSVPVARLSPEDLERIGRVEAEMKSLRTQWDDFSGSWERRWGTVTRAMRRDRAAAEGDESPAHEPPDPAQLSFPVNPPPAVAARGMVPRARLVPKVG